MAITVYPEVFVWAVIALSSIAVRFISRRLLVHRWHFQADDWLMLLVALFYIVGLVFQQLYFVYDEKANIEIEQIEGPVDYDDPVPDHIQALDTVSYVSLMIYDQAVQALVWLCKGCLLIMLYRMTLNLKQNVAIRVIAVITVLTWVFCFVGLLTWCYPLREYVTRKVTNEQCASAPNLRISVAVCNSATDIFIMLVTIPMFARSRIPLKKKLIIIFLFSLGLVTIGVTVASRVLLIVDEFANEFLWYAREAALTVLITNLPLTMPFFARAKKTTSKWTSSAPLTWLRSQSSSHGSGYSKSDISKVNTHENSSMVSSEKSIYKDIEFGTSYIDANEVTDMGYGQAHPVDFTHAMPKAYAI